MFRTMYSTVLPARYCTLQNQFGCTTTCLHFFCSELLLLVCCEKNSPAGVLPEIAHTNLQFAQYYSMQIVAKNELNCKKGQQVFWQEKHKQV